MQSKQSNESSSISEDFSKKLEKLCVDFTQEYCANSPYGEDLPLKEYLKFLSELSISLSIVLNKNLCTMAVVSDIDSIGTDHLTMMLNYYEEEKKNFLKYKQKLISEGLMTTKVLH